jgi:hypothetical protein
MDKRLRLSLVILFYALMFTYAMVNAYRAVTFPQSFPEWYPRAREGRVWVRHVATDGRASVLQVGDEVVALNGQPVSSIYPEALALQPPQALVRLAPGSFYTLIVRRNGQLQPFTLQTGVPRSTYYLRMLSQSLLLPIPLLLTGLIIFLLKPDDKQAFVMALMFAVFIPPTAWGWIEGLPRLLAGVLIIGPMITPLTFPLFFHFFLIFPEPSPLVRRFPRLEWLPYVPYLFILLPTAILLSLTIHGVVDASGLLFSPSFFWLRTLLIPAFVAAGVLSLLLSYRRANEISKRKMRVVLAGILVGMLPGITTYFIIRPIYDLSRISPSLHEWLTVISSVAFPLVPLSFAYAIIRHRVIPVSLIIRRSVQYLLAKNALRVLLALPIIGVLATILADPHRPLSEILFRNSVYFYLLLAAAIALSLVYRKRLTQQIDRKFFREHYNQEQILHKLIDDVRHLDSIPEMSRRVTGQVNAALHPEHFYLFYREEGGRNLSLSHTLGGESAELRVPEDFKLINFMELQGSCQEFPFPQKNNLPQAEKEWLARLKTRLIVPMTGMDSRISGLLLLGAKKSEIPYTARDRELLETLSDQIAIVYENVRLKQRTEHDRKIRHEVLSRIEGQNFNLLKECPRCGACYDSQTERCEKDGAEVTLTLPVERTVESRYRLDQLLGKGGMGAVYEATDVRLNRTVAVKVLMGSLFGNREALRRFEREAQTNARLSHANIITIHDYGLLSTEGAYLVMERVYGETLGALLKREGHLSTLRAADIFAQVLEGVEAAHEAGIVHRDLKPENIFISLQGSSPQVRILDFGLAKATLEAPASPQEREAPITTPGAVMGTFGYMSPEQLTGGTVDERSDLFSIGVMLIEALTGRRPFSGKTYHELLTNILHKSFHLPSVTPEASRLDEVLQKCLAKEPSARIGSAAELQRELIPALRQCPELVLHQPASQDADTVILN